MEDMHRVFDTGYFSLCKPMAEETRDGIKFTLEVAPNPELRGFTVTGANMLPQVRPASCLLVRCGVMARLLAAAVLPQPALCLCVPAQLGCASLSCIIPCPAPAVLTGCDPGRVQGPVWAHPQLQLNGGSVCLQPAAVSRPIHSLALGMSCKPLMWAVQRVACCCCLLLLLAWLIVKRPQPRCLQVKAVGKLNKWYEEKGVLGQVRDQTRQIAKACCPKCLGGRPGMLAQHVFFVGTLHTMAPLAMHPACSPGD